MQYLLDKVTVRHGLLGILKVNKNLYLSDDELSVLDLVFAENFENQQLTISPNTANLLNQFAQSSLYKSAVQIFLQRVSVI